MNPLHGGHLYWDGVFILLGMVDRRTRRDKYEARVGYFFSSGRLLSSSVRNMECVEYLG